MFIYSTSWLLIFSTVGYIVSCAPSPRSTACQSSHTDFSQGLGGAWSEEHGSHQGWEITGEGLVMTLTKPPGVVTKIDPNTNLPFNDQLASISPTFISSTMVRYGKITYVMKTADTPGAVTAAILKSPEGDEIDFEMLSGGGDNVQTNYFYGPVPVYNVNKQANSLGSASASFHSYTIDWSPSAIRFYIDGNLIRDSPNPNNCDGSNGACNFPTHASYVKFGLWDASNPSGTAQWAMGPINWNSSPSISAIIKSVTIECSS
ncbi:putative glycosidase crf2 [Choanephora cucurbitarum]|uniref:Putative glycosidase crf2 n=1 Tax=Choanephora cucurbitarum TaxID=101091 RepID=A0A1C7NRT7_9FUNG|nr:putative glycosidase crf2 [Choanephora cucurbitarum]OBZ91136.1 putative glycosidase crf2 [Choanephora cucurbitarum]